MELSELSAYKKKRAKIRLSYLLLDIFLGGFVVGIVLMTTLGRPASTSLSIGSGGYPFVLVEFYWGPELNVFSPSVSYSPSLDKPFGTEHSLHPLGFASPVQSSHSRLWLPYELLSGYFDVPKTFPAQSISMDGFYLEPTEGLKVLSAERDPSVVGMGYGYLWIEKPCYGKWKFALRHVEETVTSTSQNVMVRVSYSYGDLIAESRIDEKISKPVDAIRAVDSALYETINVAGINDIEVELDAEVLKRAECPAG
ncbi:hypothetical protein J7X21_003613 [Vibrio parahaemolyticus]|uniref:hypothetical protein n=1 Tax=Vibrio parahaemolyticus TaxID=670 RepID=UPI000404A252|nr:hypothetical protein [Vibrio parahaemolyticus]EGQ7945940.1 hypothetical protein [Vibrio parahaemolyticus]EHH2464393.1 hypothetical protein [Vibrio parahaemolyticus]EHR6442183.1 hypothetical protein [Vibrio parahaemolyticus]MDF4597254.1 hypothetical protein [Vibrio parahaemolyticus]HAS6882435.1 hypothetical protein [Vibrio parahaemolyticus]